MSVGIVAIAPAQANAPRLTQAQMLRALPPKEFAKVKVKTQWVKAKEYICLVELWNRESHWNPLSHNKSSGAFGIAQFMPDTWAHYHYVKTTDAYIQVEAGLRYITKRYNSPCKALAFHDRMGWY